MISFEELSSCIGQKVESAEVTKFFSCCLDRPVVSFEGAYTKIYTCFASGCEVHCNKDPERVNAIFLYDDKVQVGDDQKEFKQYIYELPSNVTFADNADKVKQKLGEPSETGSDRIHSASADQGSIKFDWLSYHVDGTIIRLCFTEQRLFRIDVQSFG